MDQATLPTVRRVTGDTLTVTTMQGVEEGAVGGTDMSAGVDAV